MIPLLENSYVSFVNLDHRKDRLERMEKSLATIGLPAVRTRGQLPSEYTSDPARIKGMLDRPQKGAIGCHFSQEQIIRTALVKGKHAFVMEDDLVFCSDFMARMVHIDNFCANNEWDVIWLGGTFHVNPPWWHRPGGGGSRPDLNRDAELTHDPRMIRTYGAFCTYAYIVNAASIAKVLAMFEEELPRSIGIDYLFIQIQPKLKTFTFVPGCITQYDNQSDIGKGMTIFSNFAKLGPYWFQDRMESFDPRTFNWHEAVPTEEELKFKMKPPR